MNSAELKNILLEIYGASAENRIADMPDVKIFDEPIMGVARADDGLFDTYKDEAVIGPWHMLPGGRHIHGKRQGSQHMRKLAGRNRRTLRTKIRLRPVSDQGALRISKAA